MVPQGWCPRDITKGRPIETSLCEEQICLAVSQTELRGILLLLGSRNLNSLCEQKSGGGGLRPVGVFTLACRREEVEEEEEEAREEKEEEHL